MTIDVIFLPSLLRSTDLSNQTVIVFDVLRATTTITAALDAKITRLQIFMTPQLAKEAANVAQPRPLLCGEIKTIAPPGFDFGNSPGQFNSDCAGREIFMSTTNGTVALLAARSAGRLFAGALTNAAAVAAAARKTGSDILLLCSGTSGQVSIEDVLGAGAVIDALGGDSTVHLADSAHIARDAFGAAKRDLPAALRRGQGARNIIAAKLEPDIDFAARLNVSQSVGVGRVEGDRVTILPAE